jgi:hypothetical protein
MTGETCSEYYGAARHKEQKFDRRAQRSQSGVAATKPTENLTQRRKEKAAKNLRERE